MFAPGKPFQPSLVFRDKPSNLLQKPYIKTVISFIIQAAGRALKLRIIIVCTFTDCSAKCDTSTCVNVIKLVSFVVDDKAN